MRAYEYTQENVRLADFVRRREQRRGEWLAFLNNDTEVAPDWFARLHASADAHPESALFTSRIVLMDDPLTVDSAGDGYLRAGGAFKHGRGGPADAHETSRAVFAACGAAFLIRRDVFEALGGFDELRQGRLRAGVAL